VKFPSRRALSLRSWSIVTVSVMVGAIACDRASAETRPKWELGVGSVFYTQPDYVGSDEYRFHPIPFPWVIYRGSRLRLDRESMQTRIFGTDLVRLDLSAGGQVSVDSDDNDRRHGMHDLDWIAQIGPTVKFRVAMSENGRHVLDVDVPLRTALAVDLDNFAYEGLVASPKLQYRFEPDVYRVEANAGLEFSNNEYNEYIYGVAPQFETPSRRAYNPNGGYAGFRISTGVSRYFGPFYVGIFARYTNLAGAAFENSPLVGSDSAFMGGIAIGWVWLSSKEMVPVGAEANLAAHEAAVHRNDPAPPPSSPTDTPETFPEPGTGNAPSAGPDRAAEKNRK